MSSAEELNRCMVGQGEIKRDRRDRFMTRMRELGFVVSYDEAEASMQRFPWFVGWGSHGGSGLSPVSAVRRCLQCCHIGKKLQINGRPAKDVLAEVMDEFGL